MAPPPKTAPPPEPPSDGPEIDGLIGRVYDVALDPLRYEAMLDSWEKAVSPENSGAHRSSAHGSSAHGREALERSALLGHLERASAMLDTLRDASGHDEDTSLLAGFSGSAAFVIGPGLLLHAANAAASASLHLRPGAHLSELAIEPDDLEPIQARCRQMLARDTTAAPMLRARSRRGQHMVIFQLRRITKRDGTAVIVAACSELHQPAGLAASLQSLFGLTAAEADIALQLLECASLREIAERRGRKLETVRGQVKTILAKTETRTQVELIRLLMSLFSLAHDPGAAEPVDPLATSGGAGRLEGLRYTTLRREDGRRVDYLILGDPGGRPLLFLPNAYGFQRWPAPAEAEAKRRGLRVIVPVFAGYGRSDPIAQGADFGAENARDIALILDHQKAETLPVITISSAHYFAADLEKIRPGSVSLLLGAPGYLPLATRAQFERMGKWHRFAQSAGRYTPRLLPYIIKAGFRLCRTEGARAFMNTVYRNAPADLETIADDDVAEAFQTALLAVSSQHHSAHDANARQVIYVQGPGQEAALRQLAAKVPLHFLHGRDDPMMHWQSLTELRPAYPEITFHTLENAGQLLFFRHWRKVLDMLDELA